MNSMDMLSLNRASIQEMFSKNEFEDDQKRFHHSDLTNRLRKTLYYNPHKNPDKDTLSFSITRSAVTCFRNAAPTPIRKLGHRYASRVARDACISPCALLLGLIYIERLKHKNPNYLQEVSSSDLFLISMMVASKYLYDEGSEDEVFNDEWAVSGDLPVERVNRLEADFLGAIDWQLYVYPHEFLTMLNIAEADIALSNGCKRGWLSYSDVRSLLDSETVVKNMSHTVGFVSKATLLCMVMYSSLVCVTAFSSIAIQALLFASASEGYTQKPASGNVTDIEIELDVQTLMDSYAPKNILQIYPEHISVLDHSLPPLLESSSMRWSGNDPPVQDSRHQTVISYPDAPPLSSVPNSSNSEKVFTFLIRGHCQNLNPLSDMCICPKGIFDFTVAGKFLFSATSNSNTTK